jgi:hypothetical protein
MLERLHFLIMYVGSAAMVAFLAACLSSPQVDTFTCHTTGADGSQRCELASTQAAAAPQTGGVKPEDLNAGASSLEMTAVALAAAGAQ